jgi:hypothetical protein
VAWGAARGRHGEGLRALLPARATSGCCVLYDREKLEGGRRKEKKKKRKETKRKKKGENMENFPNLNFFEK